MTTKILKQIEVEINSEDSIILPFIFTSPELGQNNILQVIKTFISQIKNKQIREAEPSLLWLAQYSLQNGFYDKSKYKIYSPELLEVEKQKNKLDLISSNYEQLIIKYDKLLEEINLSKKNIDNFYEVKKTELQQITNNLNASNSNNSQIQTLLTSATQLHTKINSLTEQSEKANSTINSLKEEINKNYNLFKENYRELISEIGLSVKNFEEIYANFEENLRFVEGKTEYFNERNTYLDNLIGREVGASLFETFKQRKKELTNPLKWWRWAVIVISILTFAVILAIFTNFFGLFGQFSDALKWQSIIANSVKSSPIFFLLYFSITQYNKERNFQEEYAFKSATALTIKAYADILREDVKKDELVLRAVLGIYQNPIDKKKSNRDINSTMDMLTEILGKGMEKGVEVITKK